MNVDWRRAVTNPHTKPTNLGCESACTLLESISTITIYYYYLAGQLILILPSMESRRLSQPWCMSDVL